MQGAEFEESPIAISDDSNDDEETKNEDSFNVSNDIELGQDDSLIGRLSILEEEIKKDIIENEQLLDDTIEEEGIDDYDIVEDQISEDDVISRPKRECVGKGIDRLSPDFNSKKYSTSKSVQLLMKAGVEEAKLHNNQSYMSRAVNILLTQMAATEGIRKHGEKAIAVLVKEFKQLDKGPMEGKKVIMPLVYSTLTKQEKREALEAINLIKEKRDGSLKGRSCANGSKQRRFLKSDEVYSSPTVSNEGFLATTVIDAVEERDVGVADVPGAYLHAEFPKDKKVILRLVGVFVDIMCKANPDYKQYVAYEGNKKVLYLRVLRALYGCLESALLWYDLYSSTLVKHGFILNPYDKCVANKLINGKQCTIVFYVDDNKISHVDPNVVTDVIDILKGHFGELTVTRGKKHNFLGMDITFNKDKTVSIEMKKMIEDTINMVDDQLDVKVTTPANKRLHELSETAEQLSKEKSELFHTIVAKLLYMCKRSRPDIEPVVSFLCTRVSKSDTEDWKKLLRLLSFLKKTKEDPRNIGAWSLRKLFHWVDASYAVHEDMKGQTGGATSFGRGIICSKSTKQKINTKSSTESELVGTSEYLPFCIWYFHFLSEQGYKLEENLIFQDNKSAILMEKNGRNSCTGNSRHINIRYFFIKDRIDSKEVSVAYCPTEMMLADYFTKPLQGSLFYKFRAVIMGYEDLSSISPPNIVGFEERVGNNKVIQANPKKVSEKSKWKSENSTDQLNRESVVGKKNKVNNKEVVSGKSKVRSNDDVSFNGSSNVRTVVSEISQSVSSTYDSSSKVEKKDRTGKSVQ